MRTKLERQRAEIIAIARREAWNEFGKPFQKVSSAYAALQESCAIAEAEVERLRERLNELEPSYALVR